MRTQLNSCADVSLRIPYSSMSLNLELKGSVHTSQDYWYWCISPIQSEDGRIHLFCSRWGNEFECWKTESEIVHFVADHPEGPFEFCDIVLSRHNAPAYWQHTFHNPHIKYVDGQYILLYITMDTRFETTEAQLAHQMIGLAYASSPYGPWSFYKEDGIVIRKSDDPDHWTTSSCCGCSNPAFDQIDGQYYIYFKSGKKMLPTHIEDFYGCATSDTLLGEYTLSTLPITDNRDYIEDATAFTSNGIHYLLTTDNFGTHIGGVQGGMLWQMKDNFFALQDAKVAFGLLTDYTELSSKTTCALGNTTHKFERPSVLLLEGIPSYFYACNRTSLTGTGRTETYALKINNFHE